MGLREPQYGTEASISCQNTAHYNLIWKTWSEVVALHLHCSWPHQSAEGNDPSSPFPLRPHGHQRWEYTPRMSDGLLSPTTHLQLYLLLTIALSFPPPMSDFTSWTPSARTRPALCENLEYKVCVFSNADGVENHLSRSPHKIRGYTQATHSLPGP